MEDLTKLDLPEIKSLCKKYDIGIVGEKKDLIKKLKYYLEPIQDVLNTHHGRKLNKNQKIVGVKISEKDKINEIVKKKGHFLYYSLGYQYYLITE
jgi:hypothetical protein